MQANVEETRVACTQCIHTYVLQVRKLAESHRHTLCLPVVRQGNLQSKLVNECRRRIIFRVVQHSVCNGLFVKSAQFRILRVACVRLVLAHGNLYMYIRTDTERIAE